MIVCTQYRIDVWRMFDATYVFYQIVYVSIKYISTTLRVFSNYLRLKSMLLLVPSNQLLQSMIKQVGDFLNARLNKTFKNIRT